ncbi:SelT/SelW/SelH family protein [Chitiniphilus eburneus]|uniref:SelT/SelW/SelH family protein n=1 Tax=Chitiniphilus eburneus TaxID=2571148 RepID=A0A4U0PUB0_9NEIS|nr:SelT/SelW/SelH family protein [Chitiniphilus eburneus]TJZ71680.1 SelT/SelW/SelH family protein [Chitiniphilus eburneus]
MATDKPRIVIHYCTQCHWLLRAAWLAQELLSTFADEVGEVALAPGRGGIFEIHCDGVLVWDRKRDEGFPQAAELKQKIRDLIAPDRPLGHSDRRNAETDSHARPSGSTSPQQGQEE